MSYSDGDGRPREVEIIPPGHDAHPRPNDNGPIFVTRQRIYIARPGPLGMLLGLVGLGVIAALVVVAILGLFLLWLPILGIVAAVAILSALLRGPRLRR